MFQRLTFTTTFIPSGGANNRESSTLLKRRAGPKTKSSPRAEERRARRESRSETGLQRSVMYDGAQPVTDRQTSGEILYKMRWETGNQRRTSCMSAETEEYL